jgi:hypothetical protein
MFLVKIIAAVVLIGLVAFAQTPKLEDAFTTSEFRLPYDQRLRTEAAAQLIIFGEVREVNAIGNPRSSPGDSRVRTQLNRLKVSVEEVIKGSVRSNTIEFYYFTYSTDNTVDLGVRRYIPSLGQRRIFFLKPSDSFYRSVGDVTDYTLQVGSGVHAPGFCRGKEPGCCIAEMLLIPGRDLNVDMFVQGLYKAGFAAKLLCSVTVTQDLVRRLTRNPDERISDRARQVLSMIDGSPN